MQVSVNNRISRCLIRINTVIKTHWCKVRMHYLTVILIISQMLYITMLYILHLFNYIYARQSPTSDLHVVSSGNSGNTGKLKQWQLADEDGRG